MLPVSIMQSTYKAFLRIQQQYQIVQCGLILHAQVLNLV